MLWKAMKLGAVAVTGAVVLGGIVFGSDLGSYLRSSRTSVLGVVKDNIPVDFQIRRAKDLLAATEPEMHRNIRLMAEEEVDIALLTQDIARSTASLDKEKSRLQKLRSELATPAASYEVNQITYTRDQLVQELDRRFRFYQEAESALAQKRDLLANRQRALVAAGHMIEEARGRRAVLAARVEALEGRQRLVTASSSGARVQFDQGKLAQAEHVVAEVSRELDVAEHALAREATFVEPAIPDAVNEKELLGQIDETLSAATPRTPVATAK